MPILMHRRKSTAGGFRPQILAMSGISARPITAD
jgi:hypothetical protein